MAQINYETYCQAIESGNTSIIEKKIGLISDIEFLPKNKKMVKISVDFGNDDKRTVISNIGGRLADINVLKGIKIPFVTNLEPAIISKHESQAMIMIEEKDGQLVIPTNS